MKIINSVILLLIILFSSGCMVSTSFDEETKEALSKVEACEKMCLESSVVETVNPARKTNFWTHVFFSWLPYSFYFAYYGIGLIVGVFIFRDASKRESLAFNIKPFWWGAIVFLEPPLGIISYWLIHYSSFSTKQNEE